MLDLFLLWQCDFADWALFCCTAACYIQSTGRTSATTILSSKWTSGLLYFAVLVTLPHNNLPSVMVIWKFNSNPLQYGQQMMIGQPRPVFYMPYPAVRLLYPYCSSPHLLPVLCCSWHKNIGLHIIMGVLVVVFVLYYSFLHHMIKNFAALLEYK